MTILYSDPLFQQHETGRHPETPRRWKAIQTALDASGLASNCTAGEYQPLSEAAVAHVHDAGQIARVKQLCAQGGGRIDADTVVSPQSFEVSLAAAGACVAAVDAVIDGKSNNALCLVRPPGHHANATQSMGFCLFNNVALAADHARRKHGLRRILIVDWDVHHGNGTQDIFYEDPDIFFFSIHRYPFYPGTGAANETGSGKGLGTTLNLPITYGTSRKDYLDQFAYGLEASAARCKPELVLISAGFDAHAKDPIGSLDLEVEDFATLTKLVLDVANTHANGRIVSCLEGGYNLEFLPLCVEAHLGQLLKSSQSGE